MASLNFSAKFCSMICSSGPCWYQRHCTVANYFSLFSATKSRDLLPCSSKRKISFSDQILDYIEGGPKLRKWYGAPDLVSKDEELEEDENNSSDETRDAVLVTDGDCEIGQMIILALMVKQSRVKAIVKDKRKAMEAFGTYVEPISGDLSSSKFLRHTLRDVRAIISPTEGFISNVGNLSGVKHAILLSQLSAYRGTSGLQALLNSSARKLAEQDEDALVAMDIPYTIIRAGVLQDVPGGTMGFSFAKGCALKGTLSKEDSAFICAEALQIIPEQGCIFEVVNGEETISDWREQLSKLTGKQLY